MKKFDLNLKNIFKKISEWFSSLLKSRSLKYGSNSIILIIAVIAIAIVINMIVDLVEVKWDLTPEKLFSIGDTTNEILDNIEKDVRIIGLFDEGRIDDDSELKEINEIISQYEKNDHITVEYVDPDKKPGIKKELDPDGLKDIGKSDFVVKCGKKIKVLDYYDMFDYKFTQDFQQHKQGNKAEQSITGAIKYVTSENTPVIYFLTGHDEKKVEDDYSAIKQFLERNNYDVAPVNLVTEEKVPEDCDILIIASPKKDLAPAEREKFKEYMANGGNSIMMFDPLERDLDLTNFQNILRDYGVALNYDTVVENNNSRCLPNRPKDLIPILQDTKIGSNFDTENFMMLMPNCRSIDILKNAKDYIEVDPLLKTSKEAVGEMIDPTRGKNIKGPMNLAVIVEDKGGYELSKLVVIGNSDFMTDSMYESMTPNGIYFFLDAMQWMSTQKNEVMIAPKNYEVRRLQMNAVQVYIIAAIVTILLPLLILGSGIFIWMRRRHL